MLVISSREFRDSQKKYLDLSTHERVVIKRRNEFIELVPCGSSIAENPSPSNDPWFDNPQNIAALRRGIEQLAAGQGRTLSQAEQKELFAVC